jgi:copper transport protein
MLHSLKNINLCRSLCVAFFCAVCLTLLLPTAVGAISAHAILLRSDPANNANLPSSPGQVHMWFSEDLSPALTTAQVINSARKRIDKNDARINVNDSKEMDISLQANLPPDVYVVIWRSDSANDGHVLLGSFLFTVENPDGSIPQLAPGANPGQGILGNANTNNSGTLDATSNFNLIAVTLAELGAIFWVGAQFWLNFVLQTTTEKHPEEQELNRQIEERFEQRFSLPTLVLLLLANLGVLYGQVLTAIGGDWRAAFSIRLLSAQATSGHFGTYWLMRMTLILLALIVGLFMVLSKKRPRIIKQTLPLIYLFLGAMLFVAMTLSGHAASVSTVLLPYSIVIDWLHLVAAALWVGGMIYILLIYLPTLKPHSLSKQTGSLLKILSQYSPLAIAGVVIMAISGPLTATFHLTSFDQFFSTAYGRALVVKILLVSALLATSAYHVFWLRPRLKKEYLKYSHAQGRLEKAQASVQNNASETLEEVQDDNSQQNRHKLLEQQIRLREKRLAQKTTLMTKILRWEPWLGVGVIICVGLMNIFAGTLTTPTTPTTPQSTAKAFHGIAKTTDGKYSVTLNISPNRLGPNIFTVEVADTQTGKPLGANEVGVTIYATMLDMQMGTDSVNLQPDGKGGFSATQDLVMNGKWAIEVQLRTLDNQLHQANFTIVTSF